MKRQTMIELNLQYFSQEKTEKATPKKREDTKKKGQIAKSADINTAIILLFMFVFFSVGGGYMKDAALGFFINTFTQDMSASLTIDNVMKLFIEIMVDAGLFLAPIMGVAAAAAIFANYIQVGPMFSGEVIKAKLDRLNPLQGFKRIYSVRALVEFIKSLLKISLVGFATFLVIWLNLDELLVLSQQSLEVSLQFFAETTVMMGLSASILLIFLAGLDYFYQRFDHEKNIRMSKQDVKDEYKKSEGDPLIRSKRKEKQKQMAMQRMMQEVPHADVVITNPTHFAVALKYDESVSEAPYVIAKGQDHMALRIKELAKEANIALVENKPLARALYAQLDVLDAIPANLFQAVAEVLAYVYQLKNNTKTTMNKERRG
ncbi:flagellar biosynthesis protein FlhB [Aureibacillus halotolerans]|uniref:Flagellar biosynthetic protein FlhB n=1 Tax=Aureibacillus halotolerans TaxID=1508390 RepID=A0A4R6U4G3_9BACI|nr:flagellar biosynthesis protein FlhB [Aureibacillus halotolerans]TDQ39663.1 flagellar biosynthetic protein FlhB [Aureibacillus halotolerans]